MAKWEYHRIRADLNNEDVYLMDLEAAGRRGWEAYAVTTRGGVNTYHLKREIKPAAKPKPPPKTKRDAKRGPGRPKKAVE